MPTIGENLDRWERDHSWALQGDEWSPGSCAGGTRFLWQRTVLPRICRFIPAATIVEIGPGFGRWTAYLREQCSRLILIDLSARCIEACAQRFAGDPRLEYHVNDGRSLAMIADHSVDLAFSFDSLVHAEADAVRAYVHELSRVLKPGGAAFIHHSNLHAFASARSGRIPSYVGPRNWRAESMSASLFHRYCDEAGMWCRSQEVINWIGRGRRADRHHLAGRRVALTDCLSVLTNEPAAGPPQRISNYAFVEEWRSAVWMLEVYGSPLADVSGEQNWAAAAAAARGSQVALIRRKFNTLSRLWRQRGVHGVVAHTRQRLAEAVEFAASAAVCHLRGAAIRWFASQRAM